MTKALFSVSLACALACVPARATVDLAMVDDLKPLAMRVYGVRKAVPESDKTVRIVLGSSFTDARREVESYRIISTDDPTYAYDKFVRPAEVKTGKDAVEFARPPAFWANPKANLDLKRVEVAITLPEPMKPGCHYSILAQGIGTGGGSQVTSGTCAACFTYQGKDSEWDSAMDDPASGKVDGDVYAERVSGLRKVSPIGDGILLCEFGHAYSEASGKKLANWKVTVNGKPREILALGRRSLIECYNPTGGWGGQFGAFMYNNVYLDIGDDLKDGDKVQVEVTGQITTAAKQAGFVFDAKKTVSRSFKVNQLGYITDGLKVAYLAEHLGSMPEENLAAADVAVDAPVVFSVDQFYAEAGKGTQEDRDLAQKAEAKVREEAEAAALEAAKAAGGSVYDYGKLAPFALRFKEVPKFRVCDAKSGKIVFEGTAKFIHNGYYDEGINGNMCAENVYELDFTEFKTPGHYFLSADGVGRSYAFEIASDIYRKALKVSAQGMYEQRCGCALDPKLTGGWTRIACHDTGIVTTTEKRYRNGAWGHFMDNCETDPNPEYPQVKAAREKVENDPGQVKLAFRTIGNTKEVKDDRFGTAYMTGEGDSNGIETQYTVDPAKGCTFSFFSKRIDSYAQNKWGGEFMKFGGKTGFTLSLSWGSIGGIGRINTPGSPWHHFVVRIQPADEKGMAKAEVLFNGRATSLTRTLAIGNLDPTIGLGYVNWEAAEGTYFGGFRMFERALSDKELADLTASVPETLPHKIPAKGGHHDAGDYNPRSHIDVAQSLLYAYELNPAAFTDNQLPVPEHDNGIPDIVDEALWAVKLWEGLQCEDGGVYNGTEAQGDPNFVQTVELDDKGDFTWAKDTKGSYLASAIFAQSSRILKKVGKADRAKELLDRAVRAYDWAVKNPDEGFPNLLSYGEYNHSLRAYAAAELFHTTYDKKYDKDFRDNVPYGKVKGAELEIYRYFDCSLACYSYALIPAEKCDATVRAGVIAAIDKQADMFIRNCESLAFKYLKHPYSPINWGTGAYHNFALPVAFMWGITEDPAKKTMYRDWLIRTCDNTLGANPLGLCWMTGIGTRTIRCPLHNSRYRAAGVAADGLQGQGPMQGGNGYCFVDTCYPWFKAGVAKMHAFADVHFCIAMDEPTANNMANTMMVFGLLSK